MSTSRPSPVERRRKPEIVRMEALRIARELLIANGPGAITLKAIGARLGMTHANLIHHFGSAESFQAQLRDSMVKDITRKATGLVGGDAPAGTAATVEQVFDAYAAGGIGMVMAWSILSGGGQQAADIRETTGQLVAVVERNLHGPDAGEKARRMVALVTMLAFADSLIGKSLAETVGIERDAIRDLTTKILDTLAIEP